MGITETDIMMRIKTQKKKKKKSGWKFILHIEDNYLTMIGWHIHGLEIHYGRTNVMSTTRRNETSSKFESTLQHHQKNET